MSLFRIIILILLYSFIVSCGSDSTENTQNNRRQMTFYAQVHETRFSDDTNSFEEVGAVDETLFLYKPDGTSIDEIQLSASSVASYTVSLDDINTGLEYSFNDRIYLYNGDLTRSDLENSSEDNPLIFNVLANVAVNPDGADRLWNNIITDNNNKGDFLLDSNKNAFHVFADEFRDGYRIENSYMILETNIDEDGETPIISTGFGFSYAPVYVINDDLSAYANITECDSAVSNCLTSHNDLVLNTIGTLRLNATLDNSIARQYDMEAIMYELGGKTLFFYRLYPVIDVYDRYITAYVEDYPTRTDDNNENLDSPVLTVTESSTSTIKLNININDNNLGNYYRLEYADNENFENSSILGTILISIPYDSSLLTEQNSQLVVSDLNPNITYYFRAQILPHYRDIFRISSSDFSDVVSQTTHSISGSESITFYVQAYETEFSDQTNQTSPIGIEEGIHNSYYVFYKANFYEVVIVLPLT